MSTKDKTKWYKYVQAKYEHMVIAPDGRMMFLKEPYFYSVKNIPHNLF